jgi:hypothetical protein
MTRRVDVGRYSWCSHTCSELTRGRCTPRLALEIADFVGHGDCEGARWFRRNRAGHGPARSHAQGSAAALTPDGHPPSGRHNAPFAGTAPKDSPAKPGPDDRSRVNPITQRCHARAGDSGDRVHHQAARPRDDSFESRGLARSGRRSRSPCRGRGRRLTAWRRIRLATMARPATASHTAPPRESEPSRRRSSARVLL